MLRVVVHFSRPPGTNTAVFKEAQQAGMREMLEYWHEHYFDEHFKASAHRRYGYQPRFGSGEGPWLKKKVRDPRTGRERIYTVRNDHYNWRKLREKGHMDPLVFSGDTHLIAGSASHFNISTTINTARGKFVGLPSYFYRYHKAMVHTTYDAAGNPVTMVRDQPDKAKELTTLIQPEVDRMMAAGHRRITSYFQQYRRPTSVAVA